jgi:codanin-1
MEENFFHNHPTSMKRVIDFVADRTASNFIKNFRATLLQESVVEGKDKVVKQMLTLPEGSPTSKMKVSLNWIFIRLNYMYLGCLFVCFL